jgi:hypothetical protein
MLVQAPNNARNDTLNKAPHALFRFVAAEELPHGAISDALLAAAQHVGLWPQLST